MATSLWLTGDDAADALLDSDPLALLIGMLLDQQVPMETAFAGPAKLSELQAPGWQQACGDYGEPEARRSIADVRDATSLQEVRATKKAMKVAAKAAKTH